MPGLLNQLSSSRGSRYGQYTADTPFTRAATGILDVAGAVARPAAAMLPYGGLLSGYTAEDIATLQQPDEPAISIRNPLSPNIPGVDDNVLDISQHDLAGIGLLGDALDFLPAVGAGIGSAAWLAKQMGRGGDAAKTAGKMGRQSGILGGAQGAAAQARAGNAAPQQALEHASLLEMQGAPRERIWQETADGFGYGVMRGPDGKLRYEIDDAQMYLDDTGGFVRDETFGGYSANLGDALKHPEVRQAYPGQLENQAMVLQPLSPADGQRGAWRGDAMELGAPAQVMDAIETGQPHPLNYDKNFGMSDTAIHELQHGVQDIEDFARGGSPLMDTGSSIGTIDPDASARAYDQYYRLAGEAEARAVQARMNMSPAERAANPFWSSYDVPEDDMIVRMGGGLLYNPESM